MKLQPLLALLALLALAGCKEKEAQPTEPGAQGQAQAQAKPNAPKAAPIPADSPLRKPGELNEQAPATYKVRFETTKGPFTLEVHRDWAPLGADRFYNLVKNGYYDNDAFFRAVPNFMVQFGIHGDPSVAKVWRTATIKDDPVKESNKRGTITFATSGRDARTTQVFINFRDNAFLDRMDFAPFGKVTEGMDVVDSLYQGYGEGAPRGAGPDQARIQSQGNEYLQRDFPNLDYVKTAKIVE